MKVESVKAYPIRMKARERLTGGSFSYAYYQTVLVKAVADGVEGWGEAMTRFDPEATALLVKFLAKSVVGGSFDSPRDAWLSCWHELRVRGHTRGTDVEALSGIEIALYDCMGKLVKRPVGRLFSAKPEPRVPAFAGSLFESRGSLAGQIREAKSAGLEGAKVKIGFGVDKDLKLLNEVRKLWPEGMLVADANGAYDSVGAARACTAFSGLRLAWFEEPVPSDDLQGYASLSGLGVKIGAGESWFAGDFQRPVEEGIVDVLEPSVSRCGGIHVEVEAAKSAAAKRIQFSPMTGMNSAVSLAASLHAASAVRSLGVEYNPFTNPLQTELATGIPEPAGGGIGVPQGHGLGIEVDERFVRSHTL